ncbi:MAG: Gfo/Idh/MocA family oxidoreductase [Clostridiaceae bacterium]|nr:Gfo/Idh/MocA family oxidoreductase [Clostridiaceae bacterium]
MLKIGLIGAGFIGQTHSDVYTLLRQVKPVRVVAVADLDHERAANIARIHGASVYTRPEDLIADPEVAAVDICLPTHLHAHYTIKALLSAKPVFVEKPAVLNAEEAAAVVQCMRETGQPAMGGMCIRYWAAYTWLRDAIMEERYGKLKFFATRRLSKTPNWGYENWYQDPQKSGGALLDLLIHDIDYVRWILGEPSEIVARGEINQLTALLTWADGTRAQIEGGWDYPDSFPFIMSYRAKFEKATAIFENTAVTVYAEDGRNYQPNIWQHLPDVPRIARQIRELNGYYAVLNAFVDHLLEATPIRRANLTESIASVQLTLNIADILNGVAITVT